MSENQSWKNDWGSRLEQASKGFSVAVGALGTLAAVFGVLPSPGRLVVWLVLAFALFASWRKTTPASHGIVDSDGRSLSGGRGFSPWKAAFLTVVLIFVIDGVNQSAAFLAPATIANVQFNTVANSNPAAARLLFNPLPEPVVLTDQDKMRLADSYIELTEKDGQSCSGTPRDQRMFNYLNSITSAVSTSRRLTRERAEVLYDIPLNEHIVFDICNTPLFSYVVVEDVEIVVSRYAEILPPCGEGAAKTSTNNPMIVAVLRKPQAPGPWTFNASYLLDDADKGTALDWGRKKLEIEPGIPKRIILTIEAEAPGYYTYTASVIVSNGFGRKRKIPLVSEPRTVLYSFGSDLDDFLTTKSVHEAFERTEPPVEPAPVAAPAKVTPEAKPIKEAPSPNININ